MRKLGATAAAVAMVAAGLTVGESLTANAASTSKPPKTGAWKTSGSFFTGSYTVAKKGKKYSVKGFTGVWSADQAGGCGAGSFTVPTQKLHIVKYAKFPVWAVGTTSKNGIKPVSVVVTREDSSTVKAKLTMTFKTPSKPGAPTFGNAGALRLLVGDCEGSFSSHLG